MAQAPSHAEPKPEYLTMADVQALVAAQVATALGAKAKEVPQTSVANRGLNPGEVTVQFRRWFSYGTTAYQRGQYAGFPIRVAEELEQAGAVWIDPGFVRPAPGIRRDTGVDSRMVRK